MNHRICTVSLPVILVAALALTGCAATPAPAGGDDEAGAVQVDESLLTVDMTIARSLLDMQDTMTDEEIIEAAESKGFSARVEGDSVIYTMTKAQRDEMLEGMREGIRESADELIADEENSVTAIEVNDEITSFRVSVDGSRYNAFESFLVLGFYLQGALYQQFAGVDANDADVKVEFVDDATGEVLNSGSYQEMIANQAD